MSCMMYMYCIQYAQLFNRWLTNQRFTEQLQCDPCHKAVFNVHQATGFNDLTDSTRTHHATLHTQPLLARPQQVVWSTAADISRYRRVSHYASTTQPPTAVYDNATALRRHINYNFIHNTYNY